MELLVAATALGFRHGFDWDHIAALGDITGTQRGARRALYLASLYTVGHAITVLVLGTVAITFATRLPPAVNGWIETLVGLSLIGLGLWIAWTAFRFRAVPPLRSRWMLVMDACRRLGRRRRPDLVVVEHSHSHDHERPLHDHDHDSMLLIGPDRSDADPQVATLTGHAHVHRHVVPDVPDPFRRYSPWSSFGIGTLHGVGFETPTQLALISAAATTSETLSSLTMLGCFIVGLLTANSIIALATTYGFHASTRSRLVVGALALVTAGGSLFVGISILVGR